MDRKVVRLHPLVLLLAIAGCGKPAISSDRQTKVLDASGSSGSGSSDDGGSSSPGGTTDTAPTSTPPATNTPGPSAQRPDTVAWSELDGFSRRYRLFIPGTIDPGGEAAPLVVMLHGCSQDAADFSAVTAMDAIARRERFVVVYPEQSSTANVYRCWNWFQPQEQQKSGEEVRFILASIDDAATQAKIDPTRVFVAGLSAGAAMAVVLGSCVPYRFKAIAAHSGLAFKAANTALSAPGVMAGGPIYTAEQSAEGSKLCSGGMFATAALAITGDADSTVNPEHSSRIYDQFRALADWSDDQARNDSIPGSSVATGSDGRDFAVVTTLLASGRSIERLTISGLGHAWSGGTAGLPYSDPTGPSASETIWSFFAAQ